MIQFNNEYFISNSQGTIVFTEGKQGTIYATYKISGKNDAGFINGTLVGNTLTGTYHNTLKNSTGLIELVFSKNGFNAKWKQGLEPGPMRGKWLGKIKDTDTKEVDSNFICIEISGKGLEIVVGEIDKNLYGKLSDLMDEEDYSVKDIFENSEIRSQNDITEWHELDSLYHLYGPVYEEQTDIKIYNDEKNEVFFECKLKDLYNDFEELLVFNEAYFENNNDPILLGKNWEKGILYSGFIELGKGEIFDTEKLKIHYDEVMINNEIQCEIISKVEYNGKIIDNSNISSTGYLLELTIEC
jgi:hypothetical protein